MSREKIYLIQQDDRVLGFFKTKEEAEILLLNSARTLFCRSVKQRCSAYKEGKDYA